LSFDDGDWEASAHRYRIVGPGDPLADNRLVARPPSALEHTVGARATFVFLANAL